MTSITTFEDILAVLEQNPQLRTAMRNYILDEELKQLPAIVRRNQELLEQFVQQQAEMTAKLQAGIDQLNDTLNRFMESTNAMLAAHAERMARLESGMAEVKSDVTELKSDMAEVKSDVTELKSDMAEVKSDVTELKSDMAEVKSDVTDLKSDMAEVKSDVTELKSDMAEVKSDVTELKSDMAEVKSDVTELKSDMAEVKSDVTELKAGSARLDTRLTRVESDVSNIKGQITPITARRMIGKIADVTQCRRPRWLDEHEIIDLSDDADTSGVPANELESFRAIDLVMRGIDRTSPTGQQQYIVIECSATVASNDVARAKRNAAYMTQFTGLPSKAVVIGTEIPPSIASLAERESVYCVTLTDKAARPR